MRFVAIVRRVTVVLALALWAAPPPAAAQGFDTFVTVPDAPGGATFTGCYRSNARLWNSYWFDFCLNQRANYWATGGGVSCHGRLTWRARGRDIVITVHRSTCGNGVAWAAADLTCRGGSLLAGIIGNLLNPSGRPSLRTLTCTYVPSVRGFADQSFTARRTD